ncbi:hypothetical protein AXG93_3001s1000 [Marchantia polymorpha subsp. ruderalis]|uniref:Uncharacterized protein n=1 Tax=Marchantia polymorpha subsp. ruderalis TaxID=1480154 RepID=A0A176VU97_MARPO|nr:hypothetical protein AXG93_3001s1000 [Marchantia polymorpha subsp. ruderalis]
MVREKEATTEKGPKSSEDEVPSAGIRMKTPLKRTAEVLACGVNLEDAIARFLAGTPKINLNLRRVGQCLHAPSILICARERNVRASRVRARREHSRRHCDIERERAESERKRNQSTLIAAKTQFEDMTPSKTAKGWKLVPLKLSYEELRPYRWKLSELHLDFLLWNWNCVSASICKEITDKNRNEGEDLRGNPMLWTIEHWTKVLGPCAGNDGDFMFEKDNVKITRAEEFTFAPLFRNARSGTNGWKTADYKDPMISAIAFGVMHILQPQRTTFVTA